MRKMRKVGSSRAAVALALGTIGMTLLGAATGVQAALATFELENINGTNGFVVTGVNSGGRVDRGRGVGDINADGINDMAITAFLADPGGRIDAGQTYVIFGRTTPYPALLNPLTLDGTTGFILNGIDPGDGGIGLEVSPAGDFNDDGVADFVVSARGAEPGAGERVGEAYVIFGRATGFPAVFELASLDGNNGARLFGIDAFDDFGRAGTTAGDFNGDGITDLVIGGALADPPGRFNGGETYIVFGHAPPFPASFGMASLDGNNGFLVRGETDNDVFGCFVDGGSNVNNDGFSDVLVGACQGSSVRAGRVGKAFILFGGPGPFAAINELSSMVGSSATRLRGVNLGGQLGISVAMGGDVNADGFADVLLGEPNFNLAAPSASYVVFGANSLPATIELSTLNGSDGFVVPGGLNNAGEVGPGGDVNGDGVDDMIVGAPGAPDGQRTGEAYLVLGQTTGFPASFDPSSLDGTNGTRLVGIAPGDAAGESVAVVGDINADGLADMSVSASGRGEAYVVFGFSAADTTPEAFTFIDQTDVPRESLRISNAVTITGINTSAPISVTGGEFSIGCTASFTGAPATIESGQTVCVRHTSSTQFSANTDTVLDVGGVTDNFTSTTLTADTTPEAFTFIDQTDVPRNSLRTSNAVTITGINTSTPISVIGGEFSIGCTASFTSAPTTIDSDLTACVRHTSSANPSTPVNTTLTVGGVTDTFTSATAIGNSALKTEAVVAVVVTEAGQLRIKLSPKATLRDADTDTPIAGRTVNFSAGNTTLCTAVTNASGVASCQASLPNLLAGVLNLGYTARFDGDAQYKPSTQKGDILGLKLF